LGSNKVVANGLHHPFHHARRRQASGEPGARTPARGQRLRDQRRAVCSL